MSYKECIEAYKEIIAEMEITTDAVKLKELNKRLDHIQDLLRSY